MKHIPYTYLIYNVITQQYYYGARWAKNCHPSELWVNYFTSSNYVKNLIDTHGKDSFVFEIRKTFSSAAEAQSWERKVIKRMDLSIRTDFLNFQYGSHITPERQSIIAQKLWKDPIYREKQRQRLINTNKTRILSEETREKMSSSKSGEKNPFFGKKRPDHSAKLLGRKGPPSKNKGVQRTSETKEKISLAALNRPLVECFVCKKFFKPHTLKRWHGSKCRNIVCE